jgi:hypothetical protein
MDQDAAGRARRLIKKTLNDSSGCNKRSRQCDDLAAGRARVFTEYPQRA